MVLMDSAELDRDVDIRRDTGANHAPRWLSPIIDRDHRSIKLAAHTQLRAPARSIRVLAASSSYMSNVVVIAGRLLTLVLSVSSQFDGPMIAIDDGG